MPPSSRIVFMGTPRFAVPSLEALIEAGHRVVAVVTQPDKPSGRGLANAPSAIKSKAIEHGIEVLSPARMREPGFIDRLRALRPEFIVVVAYGKILPKEVLGLPAKGCVNLHASLLPKYRGAAPINRALINGDKETGVSTMLMDEGMDTGPVYLEERVPIRDDDTASDLFTRLSAVGAGLLVRTIGLVEKGSIEPRPQDDGAASYAPVLRKEDGKIDWKRSAVDVRNLIRGVFPWPGAHTVWNGRPLKIHAGAPVEDADAGALPGTITDTAGGRITVRCGSGSFGITEVQPENKRRMSAADFLKGYRLAKGDRFDG